MDGLNIVRVIVPPSSARAFGMDMIGYDVAIVSELLLAESADALLGDDLPIQELPHLAIRSEFPVSPGMLRILDMANTHLAMAFFSGYGLSSAAGEGTVKWAQLITAESHGVPLIGFVSIV